MAASGTKQQSFYDRYRQFKSRLAFECKDPVLFADSDSDEESSVGSGQLAWQRKSWADDLVNVCHLQDPDCIQITRTAAEESNTSTTRLSLCSNFAFGADADTGAHDHYFEFETAGSRNIKTDQCRQQYFCFK
jgi:hypothetical protein